MKDMINEQNLEHFLYHALVVLFERHLNLEPCPAIKLAGEECGFMARYMITMAREEQAE